MVLERHASGGWGGGRGGLSQALSSRVALAGPCRALFPRAQGRRGPETAERGITGQRSLGV